MTRILALSLTLVSCSQPGSDLRSEAKAPGAPAAVVGGVYALPDGEGGYMVSKVLAIDQSAVHLRTYKETYKEIPRTIETAKLTVFLGHAPLAADGFLESKPKLIATEPVREQELEGYRIYLEAMAH